MERANQGSEMPMTLLLLWVEDCGRHAREERGGKSEEVGHALSGAPMTWYRALREMISTARAALTPQVFEWLTPGL